jgi:coenzyme Q-binding protein COQ10
MPRFSEHKTMPYTADQVFDLVADIEKYPQFLPWCVGARIIRREGDVVIADLDIGFKLVRETFTSRVTLTRPTGIHVDYVAGPMRTMINEWTFEPTEDGNCVVTVVNDFEFKSRTLQILMGNFFTDVAHRMVTSFEDRARRLYGAH